MRNMAFQKVGDYFVLVHNAMSPLDEEWDEWLEFYSFGSILVVTDGGAPTASQRKRMKDRVDQLRSSVAPGKKDPRVAIMTASSFVRGVITALRWFYYHDAYAAFPPEHLNQAMTYLEAPPKHHLGLKAAVQALRLQLKKAKTGSGTGSGTRPATGE
jgi:hypothetical protein